VRALDGLRSPLADALRALLTTGPDEGQRDLLRRHLASRRRAA